MANKTKKTGLQRLFIIGIAVLILVWTGFIALNFLQYRQFYIFAQRDLGENLALLSQSVASSIPAEWVEAVELGMPELAESDPSDFLNSLVDDRRVFTIAILDTAGAVVYSTDPHLEEGSQNPYWASELGAIKTAILGIATYGGLRIVGDQYLRVAFAPIFDPMGDIAAIVGIEAGADYFGLLATLRKGLWWLGIVSAIVVLFIVGLLWFGKIELERLYSRLEQAATLSGIGMMAATLAHEIKNPLAIIKGSASAIPDSPEQETRELIQFIDEEVERLVGIVESHLAVARGREFPKYSQKISAVVDKIIPRYQEQLGQRGVGVIVEVSDDVIVPYSFSAIRQVLYNLMENASAATPQGGIIRIKIAQKKIDGMDFGIIMVSDTGKGIQKEQLNNLFEPFHTTKKEGTGLGLYITKKIIDGHNGSIIVESQPGKGTIFTVALPKY